MQSDWYITQTAPGQVTLFTDRKNAHAAQTKRKFGSTYSASNLMQYEPFVDNCIEILLQRLEERSASGKIIDLAEWLQYYAFDVIGEITFSHRFGVLENGSDQNGLLDAIHKSFAYSATIGLYTWIHPYAWWHNSLFQSNGEKFMIGFIGKHVLDHKATLEDKREGPLDFVQRWLNVQETDPDKMSMREIFIRAGQNIGAGSDTTSTTLSAIFYYLCQNPEVMTKLRLELAEAKEKGELSDLVRYQEAVKLPYLQAVIKEGMRLHPVASFPIPRVVPKGGATLVGRHSEKVTLSVSILMFHIVIIRSSEKMSIFSAPRDG
jgi:cytochrome P450